MQQALYRVLKQVRDYRHCLMTAMLYACSFLLVSASAQHNPAFDAASGVIRNAAGPAIVSPTGASQVFIENIGQYGSYMEGYDRMGPIRYGYEGLDMPVLFTPKGIIHLQRRLEKLSHDEEEKLEKAGAKEEEIERKKKNTDRTITMEWVGANENAAIVTEEKTADYHTYGLLPEKAYGYKKIIFKNIYPGIDIVYSFTKAAAAGFEYSIVAAPGADLSLVKMKYGGDVKSIKTTSNGALIVRSGIDGISTTIPLSYYGEKPINKKAGDVKTLYKIEGNKISFQFPQGYNKTKALILDPFVSSTSNLIGTFAGKAIDVDYDYAGNVYVAGGGSTSQNGTASHSHAKYNSAGTLLWTFNGVLSIPIWQAGYYFGGWVVDKASGALYIGQGFAFQGFQVVRVSTTGLYDNYISTANTSFQEDWKMYWFCNNGSPQIICAGGGTTGNNNIAICAPPSTALLASANLTGATAAYQDMSDLVIDPVTNSLYSIYASGLDKTIENRIFKHNPPYSAASTVWSTLSGYTVLGEILNRPYLGGSYADNSSNILAVNAAYLFYWDGQNLKAVDKASGATVGTPLTIAGNLRLYQGGIVADACNNVFIGNTNGTIKVYKFNGTIFDDAAAPDIVIPGYNTSVYDLALDESKKLLYASGDGFVASFDVSAYCPTTNFILNVIPDCVTASATASISPAPPSGSTVTYTLFNGSVQIGSANTSGVFTALTPNLLYTVVATVNLACSGTQTSATFVLPGPIINFTKTNTTCGASTGSITATGSGTPGPYSYSLNGGAFQPAGNFTGLAEGSYTLVVQGSGGCLNDTIITILNSNGPALTFTQTNATCGNNTGSVTANATAGTAPYQYSIDGGTTYQSGNFFTGLIAGDYTLVVRDASGCTNRVIITLVSSPPVTLSAIPASATCGQNNGSITAFGTDGTAPLQYSIDGNVFQPGNIFTGITPGVYAVTVKDAIGCFKTINVTVDNVLPATVAASSIGASCGNINGSITASGSNGIPPYQYSINGGVSYQTGNIFTGLAPGAYTITIKDATGCTNTAAVALANTNAPAVTATATTSSCAANTGTITATASGGIAPYQFSINGVTFLPTTIFNALAPGNYVVYVKDNAGCIATVRVVVSAVAGPLISAVTTPASCIANNGTITSTGTDGTAPLQYSIDGITYGAGNVFTALPPALYTVYVKDAGGCIKSIAVNVGNASGLSLSVSVITSSCSIGNGVITATATGGIAPLQYSVDGVVYQASNVFNSLSSGSYTVYAKDANGCMVTRQAVVNAVAGPSFSVAVQQNATCGTASGVIRVTAAGGVAPLSYNIDGGAFQPISIFINVAAGVHSIIVKDATGCTAAPQNSTITNSAAGTAITDVTFTVRDVLACTGEGRIKNLKGFPAGGGNNYEFSLDGGPFTTANQFRPVSVGTHTITARNRTSLCSITKLVTIGIGVPATATAVSSASACGASTGTITITGVGANTPYHASIDNGISWQTFFPPGGNSFTFTGLAPGTYPIIIADDADFTAGPPDVAGACLTTQFVTVPSTGGPAISTTQVNPTCSVNTGTITATGSGGSGPYTYSIDGGAYVASSVFAGLSPGIHAITVKDATGCINGVNISLASAAVPAVTADAAATSCNLNNGTITATGTGGVAPLEYSINGTVYVSSNVFTGLTPGNYTLYVRDVNRCFSSIPVTIANTPLPKLTAYTIAASCNNNDGTLVAEGTGGQSPYTFSINGTAYQSGGSFSELAAGFYTVYMKDARGCISTTGVSVSNPTGPALTANAVAAACGNANGSITVTASGGIAPYLYSSDGINFQASNVFTSLLPGTYPITVKDANGCVNTKAIAVAAITGPQTPVASIIHAACGAANGTITGNATGGTAPLQYSIDGSNYQAGNSFTNLPAGPYTFYVKDANGCTASLPVILQNLAGPGLTAIASGASCGKGDGTITATASGGTLPLTYSRDGLSFQSGSIFLGLAAGPYSITVKDARGCTATTTVTVNTIGVSLIPVFAPVGPVCSGSLLTPLPATSLNGITGTWSPAINNTATTLYTFTPSPGQCASTAALSITVTPLVTPTFNPVADVCAGSVIAPLPTTSLNGITGTWSPAINNTATTLYTFTASAGQCAGNATLAITINPILSPTINCGASTTSSVVFNWAAVAGATDYSISYQAGASPVVNIGAIGNILTYQVTGLVSGDNVSITVTPTGNAGSCFNAASAMCTATPCTPPTANIVYGIPFCATDATIHTVNLTGTGTYTGGIFSAPTGLTIDPATGNINASTSIPNSYTVTYTIAASGGCPGIAVTAPVTITASTIPLFNAIQPICAGSVLTTLPTVSLNGITGTWSPAINNTATTLYTFTASAGQCASTATLSITVTPLVTPTFNPVADVCAGSVIAPLPTTSLNNITGTWSPAINNTATALYTFTPNPGQCAVSTSMTITINPVPSAPAISIVQPNCLSATASIGIVSATTGLQFSLDGNGYTVYPASGFTGITPGTHNITAQNSSGCSSTPVNIVVNAAPLPPTAISTVVTNTGCGVANGSITLGSVTGGSAPFTYAVDGSAFTNNLLYSNLAAGAHSIVVKDNNGCTLSLSLSVNSTGGATVRGSNTAASCGNSNGSLTATGNGGLTPYQFSVDGINFQAGNVFTGLPAGNYTLTIKDAGNCSNSVSVIILGTSGATVTAVATAASCGQANGSLTETASGGSAPYQFSVDGINFQASNVFTGLPAGNYTVSVKDANNCTGTASVVIASANGPSVIAVATAASCGQANGSLAATGSGGTVPYQFSVDGINFQASNVFNGLPAAAYKLTVKDANGCTGTYPVTITSINSITVNAGNDINLCQGASVQLQASTNATVFAWLPAAGLGNTAILNPLVSPTVSTAYIITATSGQCSVSDTVVVHVAAAPLAFAGKDASICFGNTLQLHGSGGTSYLWSPAQFLSSTSGQDPFFNASQQGVFTVLLDVTDANGCNSVKKDSVVITVLPPAKVFAGNDTAIAASQPLPLQAVDINHSGFNSYTWSPSTGLNNPFIENPVALLASSNQYTFTVTARNAAGCEATDDINIKVYVKPELYVPNAFTPNADGRNDVLKVIAVGIRELKYFTIYNRWGEIVFTTKNLLLGWDGNYKGQKQDPNTFVWVAEAVDMNGNTLARKGIAVLIR